MKVKCGKTNSKEQSADNKITSTGEGNQNFVTKGSKGGKTHKSKGCKENKCRKIRKDNMEAKNVKKIKQRLDADEPCAP